MEKWCFPPHHIGKKQQGHPFGKEFVDERLEDYLKVGVISQIEKHQVRCSMPIKVVVSGATQKKRLIWVGCFVNNFLPCPKFKYEKLDDFVAKLGLCHFLGKVDAASGYHTIKLHDSAKLLSALSGSKVLLF